jgi:hypothetical protein
LNRSAGGKETETAVVPVGNEDVVDDTLGVEMAVVGLFVVGETFWVEAPARTMATGVVTAANRRRLPEARVRRRWRRRASPRRRTSPADGSSIWPVKSANR